MWHETKTFEVDEFERMRRQLWIDVCLARSQEHASDVAILCADAAVDAYDAKFNAKEQKP